MAFLSALFVLSLSTVTPAAASAASKLLWAQHEDVAIFTSAGLSLHHGAAPTFATSAWFYNNSAPPFVEAFNASESGESTWRFAAPASLGLPMMQVTMARHADSGSAGRVDVVAAQAQFGDGLEPEECYVRGWSSLAASGAPAWEHHIPRCWTFTAGGDQYRQIAISDDGSTAAFSAVVIDANGTEQAALLVYDAQSGALVRSAKLPPADNAGPVALSGDGSVLAWSQGGQARVYDAISGAPRGAPEVFGWAIQAALSDDGVWLASGGQGFGRVFKWDGLNYSEAHNVVPSGPASWQATSSALSTDGCSGAAAGGLAAFSFARAGDSLQVRVLVIALASGALLVDYTAPANAALQTSATLRASGNYVAVAQWGDRDEVPTAVLLSAVAGGPVWNATTPGSMDGVDVVLDAGASGPTRDVLYVAVAGKHESDNVLGFGGDAYAWRVEVDT
jgi:hypothetical protein